MTKLDKFLEWFHDGRKSEYDRILQVFNTTRNFLKVVSRYGQQEDVDIDYIPIAEWERDPELMDFLGDNGFIGNDINQYNELEGELRNRFLLWWLNKDETTTLSFIANNLFSDVDLEKNGYYLDLIDRSDLSDFFSEYSRDYSPRDLAKVILGDNGDWFERWWDTTDNVYSDVINELNSANEARLAKYILNEIGNRDLNLDDYNDDLFYEFSEEQGTENTFQITNSNVMNLIGDESAMDELLNGDLDDLKSELYSIHNNAYNGAYESECYELVMDGLQEYFVGNFDWYEVKKSDGKVRHYPKIKIRDFYSNVQDYLEEYISYDHPLEYNGSYIEMMTDLFYNGVHEEIDFRIPDYPDYQLVDKYINEYFGDYI